MHRILLIEDDDLLREGLRQVLEEDGCRVEAASDGAAAMERLRAADGFSPCLILLDLMMPGMNGWDFLHLQAHHPELSKIPIAVASAYPFAEKEIAPGIVLRKPFSPARLKQVINEHCLCADRASGRPPVHQHA